MKKCLFTAFAAIVLLAGCNSVAITGRKQLNLVDDSQVLATSLTSYKEIISKSKLSSDQSSTALVRRVGQNIANATENYLRNNGMSKDLQNYAWEFNLVEENQFNAFCMPGGKIVVYTGLLNTIKNHPDCEAMLAAVVGHEVAHAVAKHSNERMSQQLLTQYGAKALSLGLQVGKAGALTSSIANKAYGLGSNYGVILPFSRKHELEADYMGMVLMSMAGYNPENAVKFWQSTSTGGSQSDFTSTHPSDAKRIAALQKALPEVKTKYYKASR